MVRSFKSVISWNWGSREEIVCAHSTISASTWFMGNKGEALTSSVPSANNFQPVLNCKQISFISDFKLFISSRMISNLRGSQKRKFEGSVLSSIEDSEREGGRGKRERGRVKQSCYQLAVWIVRHDSSSMALKTSNLLFIPVTLKHSTCF